MEGLTMEQPLLDKSVLSPPPAPSCSSSKSPVHSEEDESKLSCPSPLVTEPAGKIFQTRIKGLKAYFYTF